MKKLLLADTIEMNKSIIHEIFSSEFEILQCSGSEMAFQLLMQYRSSISIILINEKAHKARQIKRSKQNANNIFMGMLNSFESEISSNAVACLYLNTNNLIIRKLIDMDDEEKLSCYIEILYVQSLLSGHFPLLNNEMKILNENLYNLMSFT